LQENQDNRYVFWPKVRSGSAHAVSTSTLLHNSVFRSLDLTKTE